MSSLLSSKIDGDDRIGAGKLRKLHDVEPDAADAEHHDGLADLYAGVVVDHAGRRRHRAAQQRRVAKIVIGARSPSSGFRRPPHNR